MLLADSTRIMMEGMLAFEALRLPTDSFAQIRS